MTMEELYQKRLNRYLTAMRNEKPDMIPIRPFVAEFTAKYAGMSCQEVTHDFSKAFEAARICARDFDWDAVVGNMVWVWTGLTQAIGLRYYGIPGIEVPPDTGFQYREPGEGREFMRADEYDELIDDPTAFLYNVWLPRVSTQIVPPGTPSTYQNNLALVKGSMAMLQYFHAFGAQNARLRQECGTAPAICGILKSPFDIIADKLRGYVGLTMDMFEQPDKVLKACEALMPHMCHVASSSADPMRQVPVGYWMHRGCTPFISMKHFHSHYWPTIKPILEELWKNGHQTLCYAEGKWDAHFESFRELPDVSIVYHVDQGDIFKAHEKIGDKFCLSGGIPNVLLAYSSADEVRSYCKKVIAGVARDGGYIMDASAIMQNDTSIENLRALTEVTREYGVYSDGKSAPDLPCSRGKISDFTKGNFGMPPLKTGAVPPGVCRAWEDKRTEIPVIQGEEAQLKKIWNDIEGMGNMFIWHCLLSF